MCKIILFLLSALFLNSCASTAGAAHSSILSETQKSGGVTGELVKLTNQRRAEVGRKTLEHDSYLEALALDHARNLSARFKTEKNIASYAHYGFDRRAAATRVKINTILGENVAWTTVGSESEAAASLFDALMNSKQHRLAIESGKYGMVGMAVVRLGNSYVGVQQFGQRLPGKSYLDNYNPFSNY